MSHRSLPLPPLPAADVPLVPETKEPLNDRSIVPESVAVVSRKRSQPSNPEKNRKKQLKRKERSNERSQLLLKNEELNAVILRQDVQIQKLTEQVQEQVLSFDRMRKEKHELLEQAKKDHFEAINRIQSKNQELSQETLHLKESM